MAEYFVNLLTAAAASAFTSSQAAAAGRLDADAIAGFQFPASFRSNLARASIR